MDATYIKVLVHKLTLLTCFMEFLKRLTFRMWKVAKEPASIIDQLELNSLIILDPILTQPFYDPKHCWSLAPSPYELSSLTHIST